MEVLLGMIGMTGLFAIVIGVIMLIINAFRKGRLRVWGILTVLGLVFFITGASFASLYEPTTTLPTPTDTQPTPQLFTKDASEIVLSIDDFKPGWVQASAKPASKEGAVSAYYVYYYEGGSFYPAVVQNTVAVYPSIEMAHEIYLGEKPQNISLEDPRIGDESFLDVSVPVSKRLVFRKANVLVWIWLQQDMFGDVKPYAKTVEKRISQ